MIIATELHKLHGHKGDVVCLSASSCGKWLASSGKGRDAHTSAIHIWETERSASTRFQFASVFNWMYLWVDRMICVSTLVSHESTITALAFSPDSR